MARPLVIVDDGQIAIGVHHIREAPLLVPLPPAAFASAKKALQHMLRLSLKLGHLLGFVRL